MRQHRSSMLEVYSHVERNSESFVEGLKELLAQPSISTLGVGMSEMASLVGRLLEDVGLRTRTLRCDGAYPFVFGESPHMEGKPTVLVYGHYDVQPVEPLDAWESPPFEPVVRDGRIYARGAGDNKGQLYAQLMGIKALSEVKGELPVNVKFIVEGEEESGSLHLEEVVAQNKGLLRADLVYTSDGPLHASGRPLIVLGVRGMVYVQVTLTGANGDLHSGNWGGPIKNPAWGLVELMGTMKDSGTGRVRIRGYYSDVRRPDKRERLALGKIPLDRKQVASELGLPPSSLGTKRAFYTKLMREPTLNISGIYGGYTGKGSKTIIPASASVKVDMRLVPDQDPEDIYRKFVRHVRERAPGAEITKMWATPPSRTPLDQRFVPPITEAVRDATGLDPIVYPSLGATLPDYVFTKILGLPSIIVPYANIDEHNHAPNENLRIDYFVRGIKCCASVLQHVSESA